jgi:hypothetical protein
MYLAVVHLEYSGQVNPSVLGGLIIDFGDKTIDLSVQSRVTKLNNILQRKWSYLIRRRSSHVLLESA